jgi:hypothetical protein
VRVYVALQIMKRYYSTREPWTTLSENPEAQESHIKLFMLVREIIIIIYCYRRLRAEEVPEKVKAAEGIIRFRCS